MEAGFLKVIPIDTAGASSEELQAHVENHLPFVQEALSALFYPVHALVPDQAVCPLDQSF